MLPGRTMISNIPHHIAITDSDRADDADMLTIDISAEGNVSDDRREIYSIYRLI